MLILLFICFQTPEDFYNQPLTIKVPTKDVEKYWGRAQSWVHRNSSMKLQLVTDFVIETYNPTAGNYGYSLTRTDIESGETEIIVNGKCSACDQAEVMLRSKILAYFIQYGKEPNEETLRAAAMQTYFDQMGMKYLDLKNIESCDCEKVGEKRASGAATTNRLYKALRKVRKTGATHGLIKRQSKRDIVVVGYRCKDC